MSNSELRLIHRCAEYIKRNDLTKVPWHTHGIYVLYKNKLNKNKPRTRRFDVIYVGMARGKAGIRGRLRAHDKWKKGWTHFSIFEVWGNITQQEVEELEGLFRHIYRKDTRANPLNTQKNYKKLNSVRNNKLENWQKRG